MRPFTGMDFTRRYRTPCHARSLRRLIVAVSRRVGVVVGAFVIASGLATTACAQGGAPLVTEDTNTTPMGGWEINLAGTFARMPGVTEVLAPDLDINYGLAERVQVKAELPWVTVRDDEAPARAGIGRAVVGVKWRLSGAGGADGTLALFPQYAWSARRSSVRRGIVPDGHQWLLPVIGSMHVGSVPVAVDAGRTWGADGSGWAAGIVAGMPCDAPFECGMEIRQSRAHHRHATLINTGLRWRIDDSVSLLAAVGHEFGTSDDRRRVLGYFALQLRR